MDHAPTTSWVPARTAGGSSRSAPRRARRGVWDAAADPTARSGALIAVVVVAVVASAAIALTGAWRRMYRLAAAKLDPATWTDWVPAACVDPAAATPARRAPEPRTAWTREYLDVYEAAVGTPSGADARAAPEDVPTASECRRRCDEIRYCAGYSFDAASAAAGGRGCVLLRSGQALASRDRGTICARASRTVPTSTERT